MIRKIDYRYFDKARMIALTSDYAKTHIGCVAVYHGNIISSGSNGTKTHPAQKYYNRFRCVGKTGCYMPARLHAEIRCLNNIHNQNIQYSKVRLYIYRIRKDRPHGLARPCPSCMAAIREIGIRDIYYTTNEGFVHERLEVI